MNASWIWVSSLCRGHANLLCFLSILLYVLLKWAQGFVLNSTLSTLKMTTFSLYPTWWREQALVSLSLLVWVQMLSWRFIFMISSDPNYLPRPQLLILSYWVRASMYQFMKDKYTTNGIFMLYLTLTHIGNNSHFYFFFWVFYQPWKFSH